MEIKKTVTLVFLTCVSIMVLMMMNSKVHGHKFWKEKQLTFDVQNHELDHNENFSPDDLWLVCDTRPDPAGIGQLGKVPNGWEFR